METASAGLSAGPARSAVSLAARVALGGLFVFAAYAKLRDPALFSQAIEKFHVVTPVDHDHITKLLAFGIPWVELVAAGALVLGFWTRPAALVLSGALIGFTVLIVGVVARGESFECGCLGRFKLACPAKLSWCNVGQNGVLLAIGLVALVLGGGRWSVDAVAGRSSSEPDPRA